MLPGNDGVSFSYSSKDGSIYQMPCIHFYSGNFISETMSGTKKNKAYQQYGGLCLETQHYPESPNHSHFPNTMLKPGEVYKQTTIYIFENITK
jgi:aldose 1-epimerase